MRYRVTYNTGHIQSMEALVREQRVVQERIREKEEALRNKLYEIPAELAAAGANAVIPKILRGKITEAAINGGKKLINNFLAPQNRLPDGTLATAVKSKGVLSLLKKGIGLLKRK